MKLYSIREAPDLIPPMLESLEAHWPACMPWIEKHMGRVLATDTPVPDAYVAVEDGQIVGGYTLAIKQILYSEQEGLWIATLYMDPRYRGRGLSPLLMDHARRRGGELGYDKIYLASEHVNYYEKYGFHTIGPDACAWGEPTQMFENTTLPPHRDRRGVTHRRPNREDEGVCQTTPPTAPCTGASTTAFTGRAS